MAPFVYKLSFIFGPKGISDLGISPTYLPSKVCPTDRSSLSDTRDAIPLAHNPSTKILGKLYRVIDEHKIFRETQESSLERASYRIDRAFKFTRFVLKDV